MNRLSKILTIIIVILIIALAITTYEFFKMRKSAQENLNSYLKSLEQVQQLQHQVDVLQNNID